MTTTSPALMSSAPTTTPRVTTRLVSAAPVTSPERFARAVAAVTGRTVRIEEMQGFMGRNDNWLVPTVEGADLFVKCLRGTPAHVRTRMNRILAFEQLVAEHPPTQFKTAPLHGVDRDQALLVFECLPESQVSSELFGADELDPEMVYRFGRILAEVHQLPIVPIDVDDDADTKAGTSFYALSADGFANCSGGEVEAWAMLQHDKVLVDGLATLRALSQDAPTAASHSDLRLDQFLLHGDDVYVVDWEEFRYTDPARDVGAVVGEFIHHAAMRMFGELDVDSGLAPGAAHEAIVASGEQQLDKVSDYVRRFWDGYRSIAAIDDGLAVRATGYAGWHFFDRLLAGAVHGAKLSAAERGMAGIGRNALTQPERFASTIGLATDQQQKD